MTRSQILARFPNASQSILDLADDSTVQPPNSKLPPAEREQALALRPKLERDPGNGALGARKAKAGDPRCFLVRVTSIRRRLIDEDNLCEKYLVDCCRYAGLLPGDGPGQTRIEVAQRKAGKEEDEATLVEIFEVSEPQRSVNQDDL